MKFVYKPEGAEPREWDFDPKRLMSPEVEAIERYTGLAFAQWMEAIGTGSFLALHGLLYVLLKRTAPTLKWDEVQFCMADLEFGMSDDEIASAIASLEAKQAAGELSQGEAAALESLRASAAEKEPAPKA